MASLSNTVWVFNSYVSFSLFTASYYDVPFSSGGKTWTRMSKVSGSLYYATLSSSSAYEETAYNGGMGLWSKNDYRTIKIGSTSLTTDSDFGKWLVANAKQPISKVVYDGDTLIDLTSDTVTESDVLNAKVFHLASGAQVKGTAVMGDGVLTIQKNGTNVATFSANQTSNTTANITVPTKTSELTNNSGFLTSHQDISGKVDKINITAQNTQAVYPIKINAQGQIIAYGSAVSIPSAVTESTVSGWGFTKNAGTITGIKMNGASKGTSGVVDLGTVLTSHQNISGKVDKINITAQNTQAVYPIKINAQGQITSYGSAVTIPTVPSVMSQSEATAGTSTTARTITAKVLSDTITDKIGAEVAFVELWTNGTEANFANQLVNIDLREYDFVLITFSYGTGLNGVSSVLCKPDGTTYRLINGGARKDYRDATVTTSGVEFGHGIKVGTYGDTNGNSNNDSLIIPRAIYGIKKFIVKQQNYSLPELVTKGDVTNPTISPSGSISSAHFHYALSADKKFGVLNGNMIVKGVGGTSTREYVHTGVYVEPKPSEQKIIYGTVSGYINYTSLSHTNYITVETTGELCVSFKASTNSTSFNVNTGFVRWEDFY